GCSNVEAANVGPAEEPRSDARGKILPTGREARRRWEVEVRRIVSERMVIASGQTQAGQQNGIFGRSVGGRGARRSGFISDRGRDQQGRVGVGANIERLAVVSDVLGLKD